MINVEWRSVASGYDYKKYLQNQVEDVQQGIEDMNSNGKMGYYSQSSEFTVESLTRISGGLADRYALSGSATMDKLESISKMELGEHPDIQGNLKIKNEKKWTIKHPDYPNGLLICQKDIKRGFVKVKNQKVEISKDDLEGAVEHIDTNRRTSLEFVFSLDKSISYLFFSDLLTPEQKKILQEIIFEAKHETMDQIISPMLMTSDGKKGEMLFYDFMHLDNREQDPHLHIHSNVSNLIRLEDGSYRAIEPREIFKHGTAERVDFQFKSIVLKKLAEQLPDIPVEAYDNDFQSIDPSSPIFSEVKDFRIAFSDESTRQIREKYSVDKRIKERIDSDKKELYQKTQNKLRALKKSYEGNDIDKTTYLKGVEEENSSYQKKYYRLNSRQYNKEVQREMVEKKAQLSMQSKQEVLSEKTNQLNLSLKEKSQVKELKRSYTDEQILENLTSRNPKFTRSDLIRDLAKYRGLGVEAQRVADKLLKTNQDIFAFPISQQSNYAYDQPTFTLKSLVAIEQENMKLIDEIIEVERKGINVLKALRSIEERDGIRFKDEQLHYIQNVFSKFGVSLVVGLPGTGKSFAMKHAVGLAKSRSMRTFGLAPTGKVASAIQDEVQPTYAATIDKFLIELGKGEIELQPSDLIFIDEAGMIGTRNYNKLLKAVAASGAKLVLIGDNNQLDPVSAGNTFNEFINRHADKNFTSILSEISRQKNAKALQVAQTVSGSASMTKAGGTAQEQLKFWQTERGTANHIKKAFVDLEQQNLVHQFDTTKQMIEAVVEKFSLAPESYEQKILLASTNATVEALNNSIQEARINSGELSSEFLEINGKNFFVDDRIIIQKNTKEVKNGDIGTVIGINNNSGLIIRFDSGEVKVVDTTKTKINLGYAMTVHKSQGITKSRTIHVGEESQLNNAQLFNVAATRNTHHYDFYSVESEYEAVKQSYCRASGKISLLEVGELLNTEQKSEKKEDKLTKEKSIEISREEKIKQAKSTLELLEDLEIAVEQELVERIKLKEKEEQRWRGVDLELKEALQKFEQQPIKTLKDMIHNLKEKFPEEVVASALISIRPNQAKDSTYEEELSLIEDENTKNQYIEYRLCKLLELEVVKANREFNKFKKEIIKKEEQAASRNPPSIELHF